MSQAQEIGRSGLTRRFAVFGGLFVVAACVAIGFFAHQAVRRDLQVLAEGNNVALTRAFANLIWPRYTEFLRSAGDLDVAALREHATTRALRAEVLAAMRGLSVLKVKIYNLDALTAFSTDPTQIGDDKSGNAGYLAARSGKVASELTHRDSFSAFEQTIENRDVLSSYVPILSLAGEVQGVFEIYYDVTALLQKTDRSQQLQIAIVTVAMAVLYFALVLVVWHGERRRQQQHEENLRLTRAAALSEESSRLKSEFLAHMSHELRTPLNAVLGFSEMLKGELHGPIGSPKYLEYANDIRVSGQLLLSIIDDVLDMAKIESGQVALEETAFDPVALLAAGARLVEVQAEKAGVRVATEVSGRPPWLWADERKITQIVLNLLSNAVKFTPKGGAVTASIGLSASGGMRITVADTGVGVAPADISKVLAPFGRIDGPYSGTSEGTGLGLPIAKSFAELHGASFEFDSVPGKGTRIRIAFPPERSRAQPTPVADPGAVAEDEHRRMPVDQAVN